MYSIIELESKYWQKPLGDGLFAAPIDTTFALYRPGAHGGYWLPACRTGEPYLARHLPWYQDSANLSEEEAYYKNKAGKDSYWAPRA